LFPSFPPSAPPSAQTLVQATNLFCTIYVLAPKVKEGGISKAWKRTLEGTISSAEEVRRELFPEEVGMKPSISHRLQSLPIQSLEESGGRFELVKRLKSLVEVMVVMLRSKSSERAERGVEVPMGEVVKLGMRLLASGKGVNTNTKIEVSG
jgi:hypothetical protein